jgi:hypothetical protein
MMLGPRNARTQRYKTIGLRFGISSRIHDAVSAEGADPALHKNKKLGGGAFEAEVRGFVGEDVDGAQRRNLEEALEFGDGVGGADGGAIEAGHCAGIFSAVPADVEGIFQARRAAKIAEEDRTGWFYEARHFREEVLRFGEMVEDRIAHDEIEAGIGKVEAVAVGDLKFDSADESGAERGAGLLDHGGRAVHTDKFPEREAAGEFQDDLTGAGADVESAAPVAGCDEAQGMDDEGVVNAVKECLGGSGGVGFDFPGIVHDFRFWDAREIEQVHPENPTARR